MTSVAASAVYILNSRGDVLISRSFRDDVDRYVRDTVASGRMEKEDLPMRACDCGLVD